jgi:hypothetical protein
MPNGKKELTDAEKEAFLKDNRFGVLSFAGDKPYAIPVAYKYIKETLVFVMLRTGRKLDYIKKNPNVCFGVWQMGEQSTVPSLKEQRYSSIILEGELEEATEANWSYYELPTPPEGVDLVAFILKPNTVGTLSANK